MLKRPRLPSPPLFQGNPKAPIPIDAHSPLSQTKRRRTLGPVMDSYQRGIPVFLPADDDGEETVSEVNIASETAIKEYEHVNNVLHKLHFRNHRRFPFHRTGQLATSGATQVGHHGDGEPLRESSERNDASYSRGPVSQDTSFQGDNKKYWQRGHGIRRVSLDPEEERLSVTNNYEDNNRMLGTLVLNRRLHLARCSPSNPTN